MALSDAEIKRLAEKAESARHAREALECYDKIIDGVSRHPYYFRKRAEVKYELWKEAKDKPFLNGAIADLGEAIELEPDKGDYYRLRGLYQLEGISDDEREIEPEESRQIRDDFQACVSRDPLEPRVWLALLAFNVILQDWDEVISLYGQCKPYVEIKQHALLRSYFGCLAFAFSGDLIKKEDIAPLLAHEILTKTQLVVLVSPFVGRFVNKETNGQRKRDINEINGLLISHIAIFSIKIKGVLVENLFGDFKSYDKLALALMEEGVDAQVTGNYDEALKKFEKAIKLRHHDAFIWLHLFEVNVIRQDWDEAIRVYGQCKPYFFGPELKLGRSFFGCLALAFAGDPIEKEDIGPLLDKNIRPLGFLNTVILGLSSSIGRHFQEEQNQTRKEKAEKIIELYISHVDSWLMRGFMFKDLLGNMEEALKAYDKAIDSGDDIAMAWHNKEVIYESLQRYKKALKAYEKAIELNPDWAAPWNDKAILLKKLEQHSKAADYKTVKKESSGFIGFFRKLFRIG